MRANSLRQKLVDITDFMAVISDVKNVIDVCMAEAELWSKICSDAKPFLDGPERCVCDFPHMAIIRYVGLFLIPRADPLTAGSSQRGSGDHSR